MSEGALSFPTSLTRERVALIFLFVMNICVCIYVYPFVSGKLAYAKINGISMEPTMKDGSRFLVDLRPDMTQNFTGRILIYNNTNVYIVHRCILDKGEILYTKGDNPVCKLETIYRYMILGVVK